MLSLGHNSKGMDDFLLYTGLFIVSLAVLLKASDWFIDSAETVGVSLGISPFIIGVTIVAFGTSLPELAASIAAVSQGKSDIVISTIVGSNIANIALVLGLVAVVVKRIELEKNIWHIDMPYLWGSAFMLWFVTKDSRITWFEASLLILGIFLFLAYTFQSGDEEDDGERFHHSINWRSYAMLVVGGVLVWLGAEYTIVAIEELSKLAGIETGIIALSAVAIGTSLPEVIVSMNAARKGKTSIAVGNVLGSNIFNTYVVLGISSFFGDLTIPTHMKETFIPLMLVMTILFGLMSNNKDISRWEGFLLLIFYLYFFSEVINTSNLAG